MRKDLIEKISKWRNQIGYTPAKAKLRAEQMSESMAQKILAGTYPNQPKGIYLSMIEKAMKAK